MHLGNEVLSPAVAIGFGGASLAVLAVSAKTARAKFESRQIPMMGMMGAVVFAAQMVNFQILGGSSGHLGGGALLAIALGPHAAVYVMASVLFLQAILFNDGGLLALGANIFNMGVVPAFLGAAVFRVVAGAPASEAKSAGRVYLGCFLAGLLGVAAGSVLVPMQIGFSGLLRDGVSLTWFFGVMAGVHLIIGAVEGGVTFLVIAAVRNSRPALLPGVPEMEGRVGARPVLISLAVLAALTGIFFSMMASGLPDGLEYVLGVEAPSPDDPGSGDADLSAGGKQIVNEADAGTLQSKVSAFQERVSPLPDYTRPAPEETGGEDPAGFFHWDSWQALSGILGAALTLVLAWALGRAISRRARPAERTGDA